MGLLVTALAHLYLCNLARRYSLEAGSTREKKGGVTGGKTLPQEVINNSADVQQERVSMRLFVCSVVTSGASTLPQ